MTDQLNDRELVQFRLKYGFYESAVIGFEEMESLPFWQKVEPLFNGRTMHGDILAALDAICTQRLSKTPEGRHKRKDET